MTVIDVTIIAALAAGSFAATKELARRIGEVEFNALYQQGNGSNIFIDSVDKDTIFLPSFGRRTTVGLVGFSSSTRRQSVCTLLKNLSRDRARLLLLCLRCDRHAEHGFSFYASDLTATSILPSSRIVLNQFVHDSCSQGR